MAKVDNGTLANVIRNTFDNATPNGAVWARAKALITPENQADAATILAADAEFVALARADVAASQAARKARPEPEPGTLRHAIRNYVKAEKSATFTKANGTTVTCTPKQKAAWEKGRTRFVAAKAETPVAVTQELDEEAVAKALLANPALLAQALASIVKG